MRMTYDTYPACRRFLRGAKRLARIQTVFTLVLLTGVAAGAEAPEPLKPYEGSASARRVREMRELAGKYFRKHGTNARIYPAVRSVSQRFLQKHPIPQYPVQPPKTSLDALHAARERMRELVDEELPPLKEEEVKARAAEKYPIYEVGDVVTVTYLPNPARKTTVTGVYRGRQGEYLIVGGRRIHLHDFRVLEENQEELIKFDTEKSMQLRDQFIERAYEKQQKAREAVREAHWKEIRREEHRKAVDWNERNGYIFLDGDWERLRNVLSVVVRRVRQSLREKEAVAAAEETEELPPLEITEVPEEQQDQPEATPDVAEDTTGPVAAAEQADDESGGGEPGQEQETEEDVTPGTPDDDTDEETSPAESEEIVEGEESADADAGGDTEPAAQDPGQSAQESSEETETAPAPPSAPAVPRYLTGAVVLAAVLLIAAVVLLLILHRRPRANFYGPDSRPRHPFWPLSDEEREQIPHVACSFPTVDDAYHSLLELSYIHPVPEKRYALNTPVPIHFGFHKQRDRVVAFVGGDALSYPMWREASEHMSRAKHAEPVSRSEAPDLGLQMPALPEADSAPVRHERSYDDEENFIHYEVYKADSRESALAFLKKVHVKQPGVHVIVESPDGQCGKDFRGGYTE